MYITLEYDQVGLLREILTQTVSQLRIERSRTEARDFRDMLLERERLVESIVAKLAPEPRAHLG